MRHDPFGTRLRHGLIASLCGALLALGSVGAAKAQQADDDEDTFEQSIIKSILGGLGVDVGNRKGIEYRERSPLVIPPSLDLPPPDQANASAQQSGLAARADAQEDRRAGEAADLRHARRPGHQLAHVGRRKCAAAPIRDAQRVTDPSKSGSQEDIDIGRPLRPNELGSSSIFNWRALTGSYAHRDRQVRRRAVARPADPAAARLPDAVGEPALRHRRRSTARLEDPDDSLPAGGNARQLIVTAGQRRFALC